MQTFVPACWAAVSTLCLLGGAAQVARAETVEVTAGSLNVRSGPSTRYAVRFVTHRGDRHQVLGRSGNWVQLSSSGRAGWSYGTYLRTISAAPAPAPAPAPSGSGELHEVTASRLNVRTGPSTRYRVIRTVSRGFRLRVQGSSGNWRRFTLGAETAWVYATYLRPVQASPAPAPAPAPSPAPPPTGGSADQQLARLQQAALQSARRELASGVIEVPLGANRGPRVDVYARSAGIRTGVAWCGNFLAFNYTTAAQQAGKTFSGQQRLHSVGKTRHYYLYRNYTQRATSENLARWNALRRAHQAQGSTRRFMTLRGSAGDRAAGSIPHEVHGSYAELPLRPGDTVIWGTGGGNGHLGMVETYDRSSGRLTTVEGNRRHRVGRYVYDLRSATERGKLEGFGRPALGDFQ